MGLAGPSYPRYSGGSRAPSGGGGKVGGSAGKALGAIGMALAVIHEFKEMKPLDAQFANSYSTMIMGDHFSDSHGNHDDDPIIIRAKRYTRAGRFIRNLGNGVMDVMGGFADQWLDNNSLDGSGSPDLYVPKNENNYKFGRRVAHFLTIIQGVGEVIGGGTTTVVGVVGSTVGVGVPVAVAGVVVTAHGFNTIKNAFMNYDDIDNMDDQFHKKKYGEGGFKKNPKGDNTKKNSEFSGVMKKYKIKKNDPRWRQAHDEITGKGLEDYKEIEEYLKNNTDLLK
jgi:hypothetical protein